MKLVEVLLAGTLALIFSLAVLQALIPVGQLDDREERMTRGLELCQSTLEDAQRQARLADGYQQLMSAPDAFTADQLYVVRRTVEDVTASQKKLTVQVFQADPLKPEPVPEGRALASLWLVVTAP